MSVVDFQEIAGSIKPIEEITEKVVKSMGMAQM